MYSHRPSTQGPAIRCPSCGYALATLDGDFRSPVISTKATKDPDTPVLMRVAEVSRSLGISRTGVYQLINKGELRVVRIGSSVRVPRSEVDRIAGEMSPTRWGAAVTSDRAP